MPAPTTTVPRKRQRERSTSPAGRRAQAPNPARLAALREQDRLEREALADEERRRALSTDRAQWQRAQKAREQTQREDAEREDLLDRGQMKLEFEARAIEDLALDERQRVLAEQDAEREAEQQDQSIVSDEEEVDVEPANDNDDGDEASVASSPPSDKRPFKTIDLDSDSDDEDEVIYQEVDWTLARHVLGDAFNHFLIQATFRFNPEIAYSRKRLLALKSALRPEDRRDWFRFFRRCQDLDKERNTRLAREVLRWCFEYPSVQHALKLETELLVDREKLMALRLGTQRENENDFAALKVRVERIYAERGLESDRAFQPQSLESYGLDMTLARQILASRLDFPSVRQALALEPSLASSREKMTVMKRCLAPSRAESFAVLKVAVDRVYALRGLESDNAFQPQAGAGGE